MFRKAITKKRFAVLGAVAILAMAGIAVAYFTSTGSGTGSATVGSATAFKVTVSAPTGGPLYPGSGEETLAYTVKNEGSGYQNLKATSAVVAEEGGNIKSGGVEVPGCSAEWFNVSNTTVSQNLAPGAPASSSVVVTMQDSGTNQDPCQGKSPEVTVSAS